MVSGAGTYWKARYLRSAAASRSRSSPGSASALRSEAKRSRRPAVPGTPAMAGWAGGPGRRGRRGMSPQRTFFMRYARPIRLAGRMPAWLPGRSPSGAEPVIQGCRRVSLLRRGRIAGCRWRRMPAAARAGPGARGRRATVPAAASAVGLAAGDHAGPAVDAVVEGLDAERVPGAEQFAGPGVPDGEGVHAAEPVHHVLAHQGVGLEQHLGVTVGPQGDPLLLQFGGHLDVVVDLAVEEHPEAAVGRAHRLVPGLRQVQDRQPPEAERDIRVGVHAIVVRPAVVDPVQSAREPGLIRAPPQGPAPGSRRFHTSTSLTMSASGPVIDPTVGSAAMCPSFADPAYRPPLPRHR